MKKNKTISVLFALMLLFQSCAVYHKDSVTLDQAVATNSKVKITKNDDSKLKFKKIELIDGKYYGLKKLNGNIVKFPLDESDLKAINTLNKSSTTWGNIGIIVGSLLIIGISVVAADISNNGWGMDISNGSPSF